MDYLLVGAVLICASVGFVLRFRQLVGGVHRYYWSLPERNVGPRWLRRILRPPRPTWKQAELITVLIIGWITLIGATGMVIGFRILLR